MQYAAGISAVNIEPKQLGICSVYDNFLRQSDKNPSHTHTHTTNSTYIHETVKERSLLSTLSVSFVHTNIDPPTHTHIQSLMRRASRVE